MKEDHRLEFILRELEPQARQEVIDFVEYLDKKKTMSYRPSMGKPLKLARVGAYWLPTANNKEELAIGINYHGERISSRVPSYAKQYLEAILDPQEYQIRERYMSTPHKNSGMHIRFNVFDIRGESPVRLALPVYAKMIPMSREFTDTGR